MDEPKTQEEFLMSLLNILSNRLNAIAEQEARQTQLGGGPAARGELVPEKIRLVNRMNEILDELENLNRRPHD